MRKKARTRKKEEDIYRKLLTCISFLTHELRASLATIEDNNNHRYYCYWKSSENSGILFINCHPVFCKVKLKIKLLDWDCVLRFNSNLMSNSAKFDIQVDFVCNNNMKMKIIFKKYCYDSKIWRKLYSYRRFSTIWSVVGKSGDIIPKYQRSDKIWFFSRLHKLGSSSSAYFTVAL